MPIDPRRDKTERKAGTNGADTMRDARCSPELELNVKFLGYFVTRHMSRVEQSSLNGVYCGEEGREPFKLRNQKLRRRWKHRR